MLTSSLIHNSSKQEVNQMAIKKRSDKCSIVYNEIQHNIEQEVSINDRHNNVSESPKHGVQQKKNADSTMIC